MIYHIALFLKQYYPVLNMFHYVSFRAIAALLTALTLFFLYGDWYINQAKKFFRSKSREYTPENHRSKDDMPTMGGLFINGVVLITTLLWADLANPKVWIFLFCLVGFGTLGFWDDWCKINKTKGISAKSKFILQVLLATVIASALVLWAGVSTTITFPFFKNFQPDLGLLFIPWAAFVLVGCCNAVNLTDGLDGLAIGSLMTNFATFSMISYLAGHFALALYLKIPFAVSAEMAVIGSILLGSSLGFLWYNTYPAQIFMGDVGSLSLGAVLGLMALMAKQELLLALAGGLFVIEALSVILQVASFKTRGKRLFKMAPIHHHFELMGWQESKITVRFAIISFILCLLALITLKMR